MLRPMLYRFGDFELDLDRFELRACGGERVPLEPQVFALLALLVDARDRAVTKAEIFEKVWDGRPVTDSALASRVKSARQALGDDGHAQRYIRTIHGRGLRFVAKVQIEAAVSAASPAVASPDPPRPDAAPTEPDTTTRPSIAVLPFRLVGDGHDTYATTLADALPHELIVDLSRLRWLFVTARGSSFRLRNPDVDAREVGRLLGVRYCVSGSIERCARLESARVG
jgi:DNA-binding winged helix-turn-helix (wHTH) protein